MNRIALISTPLITEHTDVATIEKLLHHDPIFNTPHLGILTVAALFKKFRWAIQLYVIDKYYTSYISSKKPVEGFCENFASILAQDKSKYFGFSSICSSYYITLMVAKKLKELRPDSIIILGGPQASATALETMSQISAVDFIFLGEIENSLADFFKYHLNEPDRVSGLCYRSSDNDIFISAISSTHPDVNVLEKPLYNLWDTSNLNSIPIESGRGCPYNCKFCSTSPFFHRSYRIRNSQTLISAASDVADQFGVKNISFVHDNMFISKESCEEFCNAWKKNVKLHDIHWSCSMRVGIIDEHISSILNQSNCNGIFIGIESGSERIQKIINKNLDVEDSVSRILLLNKHNIQTTASFIIGFPEETLDDLYATLHIYERLLRMPLCKPQVGSFALLAGSEYSVNAFCSGSGNSTISHQGPPIASIYRKIIESHPSLFSAHRQPCLEHLDYDFVNETAYLLNYSISLYRWLVALLSLSINQGLSTITEQWVKFKRETKKEKGNLYIYYSSYLFHKHFIEFARTLTSLPLFNTKYSTLHEFLCKIYSIEENYYETLLSLQYDEGVSPPLQYDDNVVATCIKVAVNYSFADAVKIIVDQGLGDFVLKDASCVLIHIKSQNIVVEEPTPLVQNIITLSSTPIRVYTLLELLYSNERQNLPKNLAHKASAAFIYSIEDCIARGLLKKVN